MALISTPLNQKNAIESASFVVVFVRGLAKPTFAKVSQALATLADELPGVGSEEVDISMGAMPQVPGLRIKTLQTSRFAAKKDGTPAWLVQATGNVVQVQCHEYTKFQDVWSVARRYLLCALSAIDEQIPVAEIGFQVIDKFTHPAGGSWADYEMTELFSPNSVYLTPKSLQSGVLWHVYQGWFDQFDDNQILHQLNLSNTVVNSTQALHTFIDHRGALRSKSDDKPLELTPFVEMQEDGAVKLDALFNELHVKNRAVIEDLLTPEKLHLIGIDKGK